MGLKNIFRSSSNVLEKNNELLEEYDLLNIMGSPNRIFLKFLNSKDININEDEITEDLIEEFESSVDSINLRLEKVQKEKEIIVGQRKVWINIPTEDEPLGCDLILDHDSVTIDETGQKIAYSDMKEIAVSEGGWSKKKMTIKTGNEDFTFEINENRAIPLKEILEDNIDNQNYDELDALLELYSLFEEGKISEEELEARKAVIYSDDIYCTNCGAKIDSDSLFCPECGQEVLD